MQGAGPRSNAGAGRQGLLFPTEPSCSPSIPQQHKAQKGKKRALTLLYPSLTPIKSKGFLFKIKTHKKSASSLPGNEQRNSCHSWKITGSNVPFP